MLTSIFDIDQFSDKMEEISKENANFMAQLLVVLKNDAINEELLIKLCHQGFNPQTYRFRGIVWRLILGYFPLNKKYWAQVIERNQDNYQQIVLDNVKKAPPQKKNDHPLSRNNDSTWNNYFKDQQLWLKIQKDVIRTRAKEFNKEEHKEMLTRIIFLCCKLNKSDYVQGMNEFAALILYMCLSDPYEKLRNESDAFYLFMILMSSMKDNFQVQKDKVRYFQELLKKIDWKLHDYLVTQKLDFSILYVRWFMVQFAQDFEIEDSLKIWDCLILQKQNRDEFLFFLSISFLIQLREQIIQSEFGQILMMLQNLDKQEINLNEVIQRAYLLQREHKK